MANRYLALYLKGAGLMTGPISTRTRHSSLSIVKKALLQGYCYKEGYRAYNNFGSATHSLFLVGKKGNWKLNIVEKRMRDGMIASLNAHPIIMKVLGQCPVREKRKLCSIMGIKLHYTADAHGKRIGFDLKTSATTSFEDFLKSAFKYGYFRQGVTYSIPLGLKEFWIAGVSKQRPHTVFPVLIQHYPEFLRYARQELHFLLYIFRNYGHPVIHGKNKRQKPDRPSANTDSRGKSRDRKAK